MDDQSRPDARSAKRARPAPARGSAAKPLFGALDLGTNNCRLLVARPTRDGFRVVDAFSRIVRLGEGLAETGRLSEAAMDRAVEALKVCASKIDRRGVTKTRCIATQACRGAANGSQFMARVRAETGLSMDVITPREEARLSVMGCLSLIDRSVRAALVIDIGGGSTELSWVDVEELARREAAGRAYQPPIVAWASIPIGVVTLAERFPEEGCPRAWYEAMCAEVRRLLAEAPRAQKMDAVFGAGDAHLLGTSGTITSLAGIHLGLPRYDRNKVDGLWVSFDEAMAAADRLKGMGPQARAEEPCIGPDRADLVLAGVAILETVARQWPASRMRVADRGLREGMLMTLMHAPNPRRRGRRGGRNRSRAKTPAVAAG